jgi:two-component system sensor histidine kinase CreC
MSVRVAAKWRPTLGMVVFAVLTTVMALPLVGLFFFRLYENELIRQTEAELIAQGAVMAAVFAQEVEASPEAMALLGNPAPPPSSQTGGFDQALQPSLDLASDAVLGRRPDAVPAPAPAAPSFVAIGRRLQGIAEHTQAVTLAGFRLLDPRGVVIAGRNELGLSLAHVEEVGGALQGRTQAVLRQRVSDEPPPPLYSISRGTRIRIFLAMPVVVQGRVAGVIYASRTPNNVVKHIYSEQRKFILAGLAVLGAMLVIGLIFLRAVTGPIHALVRRAVELGHGRREALEPPAHHGTREIALLSQSLTDMAQRLHERSDYIATFAAHVSHELKTPLTSIQGAAELLRDDVGAAPSGMTAGERMRFLDNIIADTTHLTTMLHRLRELARADNPQIDGSTGLSPIVAELRSRFPELAVQADGALDGHVRISAENLLIVLSHLADNSLRHGARTFRVSASRLDGEIRLHVSDDGEGISDANRDRIFDAFFTTRREAGGTGMGLGIVQAMLRAHRGSIRLVGSDRGAAFEIRLPAA